MRRRSLERALSGLETFDQPRPDLEQYPTPPDLAAHLVHLADLQGDLDRLVLDLGAGTGVLAIGAALSGARAVGVELDPAALSVARRNARAADAGGSVAWVLGDATRPPLRALDATVLANPPFGAQAGNRHADRAFLETTADVARVSYTVHNGGSREFVESFAADAGGRVTHAFRADLDVDRQFEFHEDDRRTIAAEAFRIAWGGTGNDEGSADGGGHW